MEVTAICILLGKRDVQQLDGRMNAPEGRISGTLTDIHSREGRSAGHMLTTKGLVVAVLLADSDRLGDEVDETETFSTCDHLSSERRSSAYRYKRARPRTEGFAKLNCHHTIPAVARRSHDCNVLYINNVWQKSLLCLIM